MTQFQIVPPPADGLADAFRSAAGRRRRTAATAGSASLLSAALVFAALTGSTGQVLTQEPAPPAQQVPRVLELEPPTDVDVDGSSDGRVVAGQRLPSAAPSSSGTVTGDLGAPSSVERDPSTRAAGPAVQPTAGLEPSTAPVGYRTAKMTRTDGQVTIPNDVGCVVESNARDGRLCSQVLYRENSSDPGMSTLKLYLCNSTTEDKDLDFTRRNEVDLVVQAGNQPVWRWSVDHPDAAAGHTVTVGSGTCTIWETVYHRVDQGGTTLGKGVYTVRGTIASTGAGVAATAVTSFTVY